MKQPYCRYCGKKIRKRTHTVRFVDAFRPYMRNDTFTSYVIGRPANKAEAARLVNQEIVAVRKGRSIEDERGISHLAADLINFVSTWDGESYEDEHFCNGYHAKLYAYMMARNHPEIATRAYWQALPKEEDA